jgi:hypothetical protein
MLVVAYDSEPFSQGPSFFRSPLCIPYVPLVAVLWGLHRDLLYVAAVRTLDDPYKSQVFTVCKLNYVSRLLTSVLLLGNVLSE